jgi:hypothetical protein
MNEPVPVHIAWTPKVMARIPSSGKYVTMSRFAEDIPGANWSIVLEFPAPSQIKDPLANGLAYFLFPEGPSERLKKGCRFEMLEGDEVTAVVKVL